MIDVALYESVFNVMEVCCRSTARSVRCVKRLARRCRVLHQPTLIPAADGYVLVAGNGDSIFRRLMIGDRQNNDLANDPTLAANPGACCGWPSWMRRSARTPEPQCVAQVLATI